MNQKVFKLIYDFPAGIYYSDDKHNDAEILRDMITHTDGDTINDLLRAGDFMILDRGFDRVIDELKSRGIQTRMPHFLSGRKRFEDKEANETRLVTLVRWVVEAVNGRLKNMFHFFDTIISHQYFTKNCNRKLRRYLRIACALMNRFCPPICHDSDRHEKLLLDIRQRENEPNTLKEEIESNKRDFVTRRTCWEKVAAADLTGFPQLTLDELESISLGKFNIKNAPGYTDDHFRIDPNYAVDIHKERSGLLRLRIQSKFRSCVTHILWIEYATDGSCEKKILRYYCQCQGGARTLGCCSHITSVLWYLGYRRHRSPAFARKTFGEDILDVVSRRAFAENVSSDSDSEEDGE